MALDLALFLALRQKHGQNPQSIKQHNTLHRQHKKCPQNTAKQDLKSGRRVRVLYCPPYKSSEITWFRNFFFVSWLKKFGIAETTIRLNRLYDKNTTVLQKWREKEPSGSLSLLRLYGFQRLSQRVRRCVIIDPFQHSGVAVSKQVCNQMLRYALRRPERCSRVPKLMGRQ